VATVSELIVTIVGDFSSLFIFTFKLTFRFSGCEDSLTNQQEMAKKYKTEYWKLYI